MYILAFQVINMVFFILFLWNMLCGVWSNQAGDPVVAQQNKQKMHVVIKMFFVMGVSWIAEIVLFFVNWLIGDHKIYKGIFLFQLINSLQVNIYYTNLLLSIFSIDANVFKKCSTFLTSTMQFKKKRIYGQASLFQKYITDK